MMNLILKYLETRRIPPQLNKVTSSVFLSEMIAKLERTLVSTNSVTNVKCFFIYIDA